ncbi:MAG: hypothetical protein U0556_16820 [Dehalococcoidia bacterium]
MFLASRSELTRLAALERELEDRMIAARRRKRWAEVLEIAAHRRRVRRAILLRQEFMGEAEATPTTVDDILEAYS